MIWIQEEDLNTQIKEDIWVKMIDNDIAVLEELERATLAEIKSYLRSQYDTDAIFNTTGVDRDSLLLMIAKDILIYHLFSRVTPKGIPSIRLERYQEAKRMLGELVAGTVDFGLTKLN